MLFCATCWSYITRLLHTPIIGRNAAPVASSCSDMLAGLSKNEIFRTPPDFCAKAGLLTTNASSAAAVARLRRCWLIGPLPVAAPRVALRLFVEPAVLEAPFVVD